MFHSLKIRSSNRNVSASTSLKSAAATSKNKKYDGMMAHVAAQMEGKFHAEAEDFLKRLAHAFSIKKGGTVQSWP